MKTANKKKKYDVKVDPKWCKACGICIAFCPKGVLSQGEDGKPIITDPEACSGCMLCELRCPDFAIIIDEGE